MTFNNIEFGIIYTSSDKKASVIEIFRWGLQSLRIVLYLDVYMQFTSSHPIAKEMFMTPFGKMLVSIVAVFILLAGCLAGWFALRDNSGNSAPDVPEVKLLQMIADNALPEDRNFGRVELRKFKELPEEVRRGYIDVEADFEAEVIRYDIDRDGVDELFVDAVRNHGNNAYGFDVFSKRNGKFIKCGEVGGVHLSALTVSGKHGIFDKWRVGGSCRIYTFRELVNGRLIDSVTIEAERGDAPVFSLKMKSKNKTAFDHLF